MCLPGTHHGPTLWAGTNSGSVYAYALEVPNVGSGRVCERSGAGESSVCVEAVLGKEIQLMHRAPVVSICVLDGRGKPLPDPYEASQDLAIAPDMTNAHSVLIASEEQLKVQRRRYCSTCACICGNFCNTFFTLVRYWQQNSSFSCEINNCMSM